MSNATQDTTANTTAKPVTAVFTALKALANYRLTLFLGATTLWGMMNTWPVLSGLCIAMLFDALAEQHARSAYIALLLYALVKTTRLGIFHRGLIVHTKLWGEIQLLLQRNMLDYLLNSHGSRFIKDSPGEAVSRFRDDTETVNQYLENWIDFFGDLAFVVLALAVMFVVAPWLTLYLLIPLLSILFISRAFMPKVRSFRRANRKATEAVTDFIAESFASIQAIKVAGKEGDIAQELRQRNAKRRRTALNDVLIVELMSSINYNMVHIVTAIMLYFAALNIQKGTFSLGDVALFITYLPRMTLTIAYFGRMMANHKRASVSLERIHALLIDAPIQQLWRGERLIIDKELPKSEQHAARQHISPMSYDHITDSDVRQDRQALEVLQVRKLSFGYPEADWSLQDISFDLRQGEFVVVAGRLGAGKTTLLKALMGLLPAEHELYWNGQAIRDPASFFQPPHSAYTSQLPRLVSDSLAANVLLGQDEERLAEALALSQLEHDISRLEKGSDSLVGSRGVKLSGGQVQRSAAARMLAQKAELLFIDDLSSALDIKTEEALWQALFDAKHGAKSDARNTCLVVSHRRAALERADKILFLEQGRLTASGSFHDLLHRHTPFRAFVQSQGVGSESKYLGSP